MARLVGGSVSPGHAMVPPPTAPSKPKNEWFFEQALLDSSGSGPQLLAKIGDAVPLVFAKHRTSDNSGGVWLNPPAVRLGSYAKEKYGSVIDNVQQFTYALVISEGQIGSIANADIYKGGYALASFRDVAVENRYESIANWNYSYYVWYAPETISYSSPEEIWHVPSSFGTVAINGSTVRYFDYTVTNTIDRTGNMYLYSNAARPPAGTTGGSSYAYRFQFFVNGAKVYGWGDSAGTYCSFSVNASIAFGVNAPTDSSTLTIRIIEPQVGGTGNCSLTTGILNTSKTWPSDPALLVRVASITKQSKQTTPPASTGNGSGGTFKRMSTLSVKGTLPSNAAWGTFDHQVQVFIRGGIKIENLATGATESSDNLADIAYYLLSSAAGVTTALIDRSSLLVARTFMARYDLRFNGVLATAANLRQLLTDTALFFLCQLTQRDGRFGMRPLLPTSANGSISTAVVQPVFTFNESNLVQGSFRKTYESTDRRRPFIATMKWRAQTPSTYNEEKATNVQYAGEAADGPYEEYDMSMFCMSAAHATLAAKYILATRKHVSHSVSFDTTAVTLQMSPGDPVRVLLSWIVDGASVSIDALYQVSAVSENPDGTTTIDAAYLPVTGTGASQVAYDVLNAAFTVS